jgi:8-oxo-dGTP pyrophosphatase MutT (NUDIX family)
MMMRVHDERPMRLLVAAGLVWLDARHLLVGRRSPEAPHGPGRLELPGGKIEHGEAPAAALARELAEEWGSAAMTLRIGGIADVLHHVYPPPGPEVLLLVYHVQLPPDAPHDLSALGLVAHDGAQVLLFDRTALPVDDFLDADRELVARVRDGILSCP